MLFWIMLKDPRMTYAAMASFAVSRVVFGSDDGSDMVLVVGVLIFLRTEKN